MERCHTSRPFLLDPASTDSPDPQSLVTRPQAPARITRPQAFVRGRNFDEAPASTSLGTTRGQAANEHATTVNRSEQSLMREIIGIDIGGANLKYASTSGRALSVAFPLWQKPQQLADRIAADLAYFADAESAVATMTGELADCFLDRAEGVRCIVAALADAAEQHQLPEPLFYGVDGRFHDCQSAGELPDTIAAANWHATASLAANMVESHSGWSKASRRALLLDIGSTTTDLIPVLGGRVSTNARSDHQRLLEGSLVYVGCQRTPVCAICQSLEHNGILTPVMREVFATMDDVRLLLGHGICGSVDHDGAEINTADGRPRDRFHAANRIARMLGLDHRSVSIDQAVRLSQQVRDRVRLIIDQGAERLRGAGYLDDQTAVIVAGHADDLIPTSLQSNPTIRLADQFGAAISRCFPAFAVAKLFVSCEETDPGVAQVPTSER